MPYENKRQPTDTPKKFQTKALQGVPKRGPGRPPVLAPPTAPQFEFANDYERAMYDYFIYALRQDYPDMRPTDLMLLPLAAGEYIKCLRLLGDEIRSGDLVMMSRQHPATQFAKYLDTLLATTRKHRVRAGEKPENDDYDLLSKLSA